MSKNLPNPKDYFFRAPLYEKYHIEGEEGMSAVLAMVMNRQKHDAFCPECGQDSIYRRIENNRDPSAERWTKIREASEVVKEYAVINWGALYYYMTQFRCQRNDSHVMTVYSLLESDVFCKIGQYPSLADLSATSYDKYTKVIDVERIRELKKAVGLASHGIGIGSFVYLRRVFENMIEDAHKQAVGNEADWREDEYQSKRMDEKIQILAEHLPRMLVENRAVYSIVSKGIHELSEAECLEYYDPIRTSIEFMIEERLAHALKREKMETTRKAIEDIKRNVK